MNGEILGEVGLLLFALERLALVNFVLDDVTIGVGDINTDIELLFKCLSSFLSSPLHCGRGGGAALFEACGIGCGASDWC